MRAKFIFGLVVITIVAVFAVIRYHRAEAVPGIAGEDEATASATTSVQNRSPANTAPGPQAAQISNPSGQTVSGGDSEFIGTVRDQARSVDDPSVDAGRAESQLKSLASRITPAQARQLRGLIMHPQSAAREKILSAYILVEGGSRSREELRAAITAPLTQEGGEVHSEEEIKGVREKSLRIMMIDGLFAQARTEPAARDTLAQAIADSADPYIKAYAQEKFDQLSKQ